jgi:protein O-GlcNAc transferase
LPALSAGHVTFGSLNNFCKNSPTTLRLWASALKAVPGSRLLVLAPGGSARQKFLNDMGILGIAADRVEFLDRRLREPYMNNYHHIDICLDTLPYNGHTTSLDAMWMGVPVVTLVGKTPAGRVGLTHAMNLKMPLLVAQTEEDFAGTVAKLASDLPALSQLRQSLRERLEKSPLGDGIAFTRGLEKAYRQIWEKWCSEKAR